MKILAQEKTIITEEAGFTLLEVLVAMTLLGLVMVLLFGGLRLGIHAWEASDAHLNGIEDVQLTQRFIRNEIEHAYPKLDSSDPVMPHLVFSGSSHAVRFLASAPQNLAAAGRAIVELKVEKTDGKKNLVVRVKPELAWADDVSAEHEEIFLTDIRDISLEYFGRSGSNTTPAWSHEWTDRFHLPQLIRVSVAFEEGDKRIWPQMVVAPLIDVDVACQFDMFSKTCRGR